MTKPIKAVSSAVGAEDYVIKNFYCAACAPQLSTNPDLRQ
jgi:hypothetical protein